MNSATKGNHERSDANAREILWFAASFIVFAIMVHVVVGLLQRQLTHQSTRTFAAETPVMSPYSEWPKPALETNPELPPSQSREQEEQLLHSYGWVDQNAGIARIPIERAMEIVSGERKERR